MYVLSNSKLYIFLIFLILAMVSFLWGLGYAVDELVVGMFYLVEVIVSLFFLGIVIVWGCELVSFYGGMLSGFCCLGTD